MLKLANMDFERLNPTLKIQAFCASLFMDRKRQDHFVVAEIRAGACPRNSGTLAATQEFDKPSTRLKHLWQWRGYSSFAASVSAYLQ
jgi:hypothetical protein